MGDILSKLIRRSAAKVALGTIALTFFVPAITAAQAVSSFNYGTSPKSFTERYVWSSFEDTAKFHGSSAYGDRWGLIRSNCVIPGARAYAESVYSIYGGNHTSYYRYC